LDGSAGLATRGPWVDLHGHPGRCGEAYADHRRQLAGLHGLVRHHGLPLVRTADDIIAAHRAGTTALFVTCEGADFVEDRPERLDEAHAAGSGRSRWSTVASTSSATADRAAVARRALPGRARTGPRDEQDRPLIDVIGVDHVAVGTDMDANYRPVMTEYGQFGVLGDRLQARGLTQAGVDRVLGANAVDLIRTVCG